MVRLIALKDGTVLDRIDISSAGDDVSALELDKGGAFRVVLSRGLILPFEPRAHTAPEPARASVPAPVPAEAAVHAKPNVAAAIVEREGGPAVRGIVYDRGPDLVVRTPGGDVVIAKAALVSVKNVEATPEERALADRPPPVAREPAAHGTAPGGTGGPRAPRRPRAW